MTTSSSSFDLVPAWVLGQRQDRDLYRWTMQPYGTLDDLNKN